MPFKSRFDSELYTLRARSVTRLGGELITRVLHQLVGQVDAAGYLGGLDILLGDDGVRSGLVAPSAV